MSINSTPLVRVGTGSSMNLQESVMTIQPSRLKDVREKLGIAEALIVVQKTEVSFVLEEFFGWYS